MVAPNNPIHRLISIKMPRSAGIGGPSDDPQPGGMDIPKPAAIGKPAMSGGIGDLEGALAGPPPA